MPGATFSLVEHPFSSHDLIRIFTDLNGSPPTIKEYTEEEYQHDLKESFWTAFKAVGMKGLASGVDWPEEIIDSAYLKEKAGWKGKTFEGYIKEYL